MYLLSGRCAKRDQKAMHTVLYIYEKGEGVKQTAVFIILAG